MSWGRATVGALTHAERTALVLRLVGRDEAREALLAEQQARVAALEAQVRDLQRQLTHAQKNDPSGKMPGLTGRDATAPRGPSCGCRSR